MDGVSYLRNSFKALLVVVPASLCQPLLNRVAMSTEDIMDFMVASVDTSMDNPLVRGLLMITSFLFPNNFTFIPVKAEDSTEAVSSVSEEANAPMVNQAQWRPLTIKLTSG